MEEIVKNIIKLLKTRTNQLIHKIDTGQKLTKSDLKQIQALEDIVRIVKENCKGSDKNV